MKLLAVDSNSIINRAYYGLKPLTTSDGRYTHAVLGFMNIFHKILDEVNPDMVVFTFDLKAPTFRHKDFAGYKAQRKGMPEELAQQLEPLKTLLTHLGYPILTLEGYEADDLLGTLAKMCQDTGNECVIATGDRDSFQLVSNLVSVRLAVTKMGQSTAQIITPQVILEKYNLTPSQLIDVKALMGDSSDNIPGVAGIGEKTAQSLIENFTSLDRVYENIEDPRIKDSVRKKLVQDKEMAYTSYHLATICCTAPIEKSLEDFKRTAVDEQGVYTLLSSLELKSLITRLKLNNIEIAPITTSAPSLVRKVVVENKADLEKLLISQHIFLYIINSETPTCLFSTETIMMVTTFEDSLDFIVRAQEKIITNDSKALFKLLFAHGITPLAIYFDLSLAGYILSPLSSGYDIESLALGRDCTATDVIAPEEIGENLLTEINKAVKMPALYEQMADELNKNNQQSLLFEIEQPLALVLSSMEYLGFQLDIEGLTQYGDVLDSDIAQIRERIYFLAGGEFNINSPKQMGEVLFERLALPVKKKTKTGYSTDADVLASLKSSHPIIEDILQYRTLAKLKSTYVEGLLGKVEGDKRLHSIFKQTETRTGRISSIEPNLQNIPVRTTRGSQLRKFFTAKEGYVLVDADYSQIELRVLAHIADDAAMQQAFSSGEDIHTKTASQVFDMPEAFVTPAMRSAAKAVNFGIVYGIGAFSLSKDIGVTVSEADKYIKNYLRTYEGVQKYMEETIKNATENGYVTTLFMRRRPIPELSASNKITKSFGERVAMNTPIQGTAADIIKIAMVKVYNRLKNENLSARLILQVHDELIVESPVEEAEKVKLILTEEMVNAVNLKVAMVADAAIGETWYDAKQ